MTRLAITMGDPAGVGPEIIMKALQRVEVRAHDDTPSLVVLGCANALEQAADALQMRPPPRIGLDDVASATGVSCVPLDEDAPVPPLGVVSAAGGEFAYRAIEEAVRLSEQGAIDAMVTAPLNKEALN
ncbi:MAG: 4-hydroxythreonine-4-phosphate dehydrogenase PdxA, partial [Pseudomonadota bacterium]